MSGPDSVTWTFPHETLLEMLRDLTIDHGLAHGSASGWEWSVEVCALDEREFHLELKAERPKGASQ